MGLSKEKFATEILRDLCHCVCAVCDFNYRFGNKGSGAAEELSALLGAPVKIQEAICSNGETVSSTRIRRCLVEGDVRGAAALLTRPYSFTAPVLHGKALGKTWNLPTVNQNFPPKMMIPRHGVYVTDCEIDGKHVRGVSNVGTHPTVDRDAAVNCETPWLDFCGDLYGKEVTISFLEYLRPEQKFATADELRMQIGKDIAAAQHY